jgi:hypothetical protein
LTFVAQSVPLKKTAGAWQFASTLSLQTYSKPLSSQQAPVTGQLPRVGVTNAGSRSIQPSDGSEPLAVVHEESLQKSMLPLPEQSTVYQVPVELKMHSEQLTVANVSQVVQAILSQVCSQ